MLAYFIFYESNNLMFNNNIVNDVLILAYNELYLFKKTIS